MSIVRSGDSGSGEEDGYVVGIGCLIAALAIPVILAVVGLLAAIAIPSFVKAREAAQVNACINNMRIIDAAKEQAAIAYEYREGQAVLEEQASEFVKDGLGSLVCPVGGDYTLYPLGQDPECSVHGPLSDAGTPGKSHTAH